MTTRVNLPNCLRLSLGLLTALHWIRVELRAQTIPPAILQQPSAKDVTQGLPISLEVLVSGTEPISYSWRRNGVAIPVGGKAPTYSLAAANIQHGGLYSVVAANAAGSVTSSVVSMTVNLPGSEFTLSPRGSIANLAPRAAGGAPVRIQVRGRYAYVAAGADNNFYVVDIGDPDHPTIAAKVLGPGFGGNIFDVALIDNFAITAERNNWLGIIDISNPFTPVRVGHFGPLGSGANSIVIRNRLAYIGNERAGVVILDVNTPDRPVILGSVSPPTKANGLYLDGNRLFAADWDGGLSVVDITNPTSPIRLKAYSYAGVTANAFHVVAQGDFAYVADAALGLVTIDLSTTTGIPASFTRGYLWDLTQLGRYLFAADFTTGLRVFDISQPKTAVEIGSYADPGGAIGCTVRGNRAFLGQRHFSLVDLSFARMAPVFSSVLEERKVVLGSEVTLEANATGSEPLSFRWFQGNREIGQATGPTLVLNNISEIAMGEYSVVVTNAFGNVTNQIARLTANTRALDPITWSESTPPAGVLILSETYSLKAATESNRAVQYFIDSGTATINGSTMKATSVGTLTARALAPGDSQYLPAATVRTFNVITRPRILANTIITDSGHTKFRAFVTRGVPFVLMASDNLVDWSEIAQVTPSQANTEFTDPDEIGGIRYYRLEVR
jgi:hypothetical protein